MIGREIELGEKIEWWSIVIIIFWTKYNNILLFQGYFICLKIQQRWLLHKLWASSAEAYIKLEPAQVSSARWQP